MLDVITGQVVSAHPVRPNRPDVRELRIRVGADHRRPGIELPFAWDHGALPVRAGEQVALMLKGARVVGLHNATTGQQVNCMSRVTPKLLTPTEILQSSAIYLLGVYGLGPVHGAAGGLAWGIASVVSRHLGHQWLRREVALSLADLR